MHYSFEVQEAVEYGVPEAIMIWNLRFWILKNKANNKHLHNNKTWTYNKIEAFQTLFPFWSKRQIEHLLTKMVDKKIIIKGNFNQNKHDRTCWYTFENNDKFLAPHLMLPHFTDLGNGNHNNVISNSQKQEMEKTNLGNDNKEPDIKPNIKPYYSSSEQKKEILTFEEFKKSAKDHFDLKGYKSDVEQFCEFNRQTYIDIFKKLSFWAKKWDDNPLNHKKYEQPEKNEFEEKKIDKKEIINFKLNKIKNGFEVKNGFCDWDEFIKFKFDLNDEGNLIILNSNPEESFIKLINKY